MILIFLKNVIRRLKVIPHKNSTRITVPLSSGYPGKKSYPGL